MVRIDQSCSTFVVVRHTATGIDSRFTYALPVVHLPTKLVNSRFKLSRVLTIINHSWPTSFSLSFMFCFFSFLSSLTMRRLLLFLVFATIGSTNPIHEFDEWQFQRRQDTLGIVNGSHSVSDAAFTPVVLVKALITLWTHIPFPKIPQLDLKPLNQILDQTLFELNGLDLRMF